MVFRRVFKSNGTQLVEESESDFDVTFASLTSRTEQLGSEITHSEEGLLWCLECGSSHK